uniref:Uncharacterized protein n=1 Tax=Cajanus cajan TaxID=3821 RepID=A0A151RWS7_CAJCA|nr:hypothetical protein KK1_031419 [Cajanus cajan]
MKNCMASIWRLGKGVSISELKPGVFLFQFYHPIDLKRTVDPGGIICMEISGPANSAPGSALGHPSLLTQLCQLAGVDVHSPPFEGPGRAIDSRYISTYCQDRAPPAAPEPIHAVAPQEDIPMEEDAAPGPPLTLHQRFDALEGRMETYMQRQEDRMKSLHRGQMFILDTFRSFSLHAAPAYQFPATADYHAYTRWPGDQAPHFGGGVELLLMLMLSRRMEHLLRMMIRPCDGCRWRLP